jgi:hypothetical protein
MDGFSLQFTVINYKTACQSLDIEMSVQTYLPGSRLEFSSSSAKCFESGHTCTRVSPDDDIIGTAKLLRLVFGISFEGRWGGRGGDRTERDSVALQEVHYMKFRSIFRQSHRNSICSNFSLVGLAGGRRMKGLPFIEMNGIEILDEKRRYLRSKVFEISDRDNVET